MLRLCLDRSSYKIVRRSVCPLRFPTRHPYSCARKYHRKHTSKIIWSTNMLFSYAFLASMAAGTALSLDSFAQPQSKAFRKRQEFSPTTLTCGQGDTCAESCGTGYILCSDPTTFLCYNPGAGQSCCNAGSSSSCSCHLDLNPFSTLLTTHRGMS